MESSTLFSSVDVLTYRALLTCTVVSTCGNAYIEDTTKFLSRERKERLKSYSK